MAIDVEANLIALGITIIAAFPAAWFTAKLGYKYAKSQEEEKERLELERSLGRLEGGDRDRGGVEVVNQYTLGRMAANLETLVSDVADIKRRLDVTINELNEVKGQDQQKRMVGTNEHREIRLYVDSQIQMLRSLNEGLIAYVNRLRTQVGRVMRDNNRRESEK